MSFTFNGQRRSYLKATRGSARPVWAPVKRNFLTVPGRPGAYPESTDVEPVIIPVNIRVEQTVDLDLNKVKEDLAAWLITENAAELVFDNEPDRIVYAMVDGGLDLREFLDTGKGSFNFICPDPYKYGTEKTVLWPAQDTTKADYAGKVAGSTVENPHDFRRRTSPSFGSPLQKDNTNEWVNPTQTSYDKIKTLDSSSDVIVTSGNLNISQMLFSFNLIEHVERKYGVPIPAATTADKVTWLKANIRTLTCNWHGKGSGPSGNKANFRVYHNTNGWVGAVNHTSGSIQKLSYVHTASFLVDYIDSSGFIHHLAYADASNGTIASTIETDFVELEATLNLPHLASRIDYTGTADTYPIIRAEVTKATPYIAIENQTTGEMMMIGQPVSVEDTVVPYEETILDDTMATLTGWANASFAVDGGQVAGTMQSDSYVFKAQNYGAGSAWHGPAVAKSLSQQLQDFRIDTIIKFASTNVLEVGRVEIHLLDINNIAIGKLAMKDYMGNYIFNMPEIFAINKVANTVESLIVRNANENWNGFYGMLRFQRIGQEISAYLARINPDTSIHENIKVGSFEDANNQYQSKVAAVGIHIATFGTSAPMSTAQVHHLTVKKINANQPGIPHIAMPGDIVEIDFLKESITRNGEDIKDLKAFIAKFFPLVKGVNELAVAPADSLKLDSKYRERFK